MQKMYRSVAVAAVLVFWSMSAIAQTADEIIEKHLTATGGRAALSKLTSRTSTGKITVGTPVGDLNGTIELSNKVPNKQRTLVKIDASAFGGGEVVQDQRFDGTTGYIIDTFQGDREITGSQLDTLKLAARFPSPLLDYKGAGVQVTLSGREKIGSGEAYVLVFTTPTGPGSRVFIDTASLMVVKTAVTINVPQLGGDIEQVSELSDFRDVDGVKVPFTIRSTNPAQTITVTLSSITHNANIDDSSFVKP
jgi:outer membrane lipoprotein-sorting protein